MLWLTMRTKAPDVKRIAEVEDENAGLVLLLVCIAALASLGTITFDLAGSRDLETTRKLLRYGFTALTVIGSWLLIGVIFQRALCPAVLHLERKGTGVAFCRRVDPPITGTFCISRSPSAWRCRRPMWASPRGSCARSCWRSR